MKRIGFLSSLLILVVFTLPILTGGKINFSETSYNHVESTPAASPASQAISETNIPSSGSTDEKMEIKALIDGNVQTLSLADYILGAIAAEMPAEFEKEALKAQAAAVRTYAVNRMLSQPFSEHEGASICDDPNHCLAYMTEKEALEKWGQKGQEYLQKLRLAVSETDGMVIYYQNAPIQAVFHSTSSGYTESSADVWGSDIPYLVSVESPERESSPRYYGRVEIKPGDFKAAFLKEHEQAKFPDDPSGWFSNEIRSNAGGVKSLEVCGVKVSGEEIRKMCSLRSTNFTVEAENGLLVFKTIGYGHGVGLSQYGADALALQGKNYEEILKWYYTGVEIKEMEPDELSAS